MNPAAKSVSDPLREVPQLLRKQWKQLVASGAPVLRWLVAHDEWEWVETFLESGLDGASKIFVVEHAFDGADTFGFSAGSALLGPLTKIKLARRPAWVPRPLARGMHNTESLAALIGSFLEHTRGSWIETFALVLAPSGVRDPVAWLSWVEAFAVALVRSAPGARIVLLDDAAKPTYDAFARRCPNAVATLPANLAIASRTAAMVEASSDLGLVDAQVRLLSVRTLQCVNEGRVSDAEIAAQSVERLAASSGHHTPVVPVRFAVAAALLAAGRAMDAVASYRAAEAAAERAESSGTPNATQLRITARFGVAAGLLSVSQGASHAARYYEDTVPFCQQIGDARLELECHRCAGVAYEMGRMPKPAWDACVRALGLVHRLDAGQRDGAMLVPLADALLRLTTLAELRHFRSGAEAELRKRSMRGTQWA